MPTEVVLKVSPISTFNDLLSQLQQELEDVKAGSTTESQARVVLGYRKAQLKVAELGLQYLRVMRPKSGSMKGNIPILPGADESTAKDSASMSQTSAA